MLPRRREDGLVVRELADETLVYDQTNHQAHCLNPTAGFVWRRCDGRTDVAALAALLAQEFGLPRAEEAVALALAQLGKARLLQEVPGKDTAARCSRRDLVRKLGAAAVLVPAVMTIVAPSVAMAASTIDNLTCIKDLLSVGKCCLIPNGNQYTRRLCILDSGHAKCAGPEC